ncbi:hypothetical protein PINS_up003703 [Pythium insidiosum]|nr:hypothetical protein PINS_up003703 [Pythium insidiosum]
MGVISLATSTTKRHSSIPTVFLPVTPMTIADASKPRAHVSKKRLWWDETAMAAGSAVLPPPASKPRAPRSAATDALPLEVLAVVLSFLDGHSLLRSSAVCRAWARVSHHRETWRNICLHAWPTLRMQVLPQLPGAPDYDVRLWYSYFVDATAAISHRKVPIGQLIRLYGGSWRRCFVERHASNQRAEIRVTIPDFPRATEGKVVSDTFSIGEHRFCLWIFPSGNPHEPLYKDKVLSVYLVLTDLDRRPSDWITSAVFSLSVVNHLDAARRIEWHSCLADNKFDSNVTNWGVHSLGSLKTLHNPANGFLVNDSLTVSASVRLMSITFRLIMERDLKAHHHLGLADLANVDTVVMPFCASLEDLLQRLRRDYDMDTTQVRVWCFNQPVVSGQALRPRKLLTGDKIDKTLPMFGNLLCDGVDIDAYSFCQLYIERLDVDDAPLDIVAPNPLGSPDDVTMEDVSVSASEAISEVQESYVFVKYLDPTSRSLNYLARCRFSSKSISTGALYQVISQQLRCEVSDFMLFKEEIAPTLVSGPLVWSDQTQEDTLQLQPTDIIIAVSVDLVAKGTFEHVMTSLLSSHYSVAGQLANREFTDVTLEHIESMAERLDIPKFRVRSAFRKCREDGRQTLRYIMEGRHLGFICDCCGETDFKGPRFNCTICNDYDLCQSCHDQSHQVTHRYANVDGKWQRIYNFQDHKSTHLMKRLLPVFYKPPTVQPLIAPPPAW